MPRGLFNFFKPKPGGDAPALPALPALPAQPAQPASAAQDVAAVALYRRGNQLKDRGEFEAALACYDEALSLDSTYAYAFFNRGFVLERLARWDAALDSYERVIALTPGDALAHYNRAAVLRRLSRPEEALASYAQAIAVRPDYVEAYCNQGLLLTELRRWDAALASHMACIALRPDFAPAHCGRGTVLRRNRQPAAALAAYDQAIAADPDHAPAHLGRGAVLIAGGEWAAARASIDHALRLRPDFGEAHGALGLWFAATGEREAALTHYDRAIALDPADAGAWLNRANLLVDLKRYADAVDSYDAGIAREPEPRFAHGMRRYALMHQCDWNDFEADAAAISAGIGQGRLESPPLPFLALVDDPALQRRAAGIWATEEHTPADLLPPLSPLSARDKVRVGYFSGDLHDHPVAQLLAQVIETHDRSRFEVTAFSFGPETGDATRQRLRGAFDRFIDVRSRPDRDVAQLARELQIDIAIDLTGHTAGSRTGIFALRAAPLQVNYLGYPGTLGTDCMDYLVCDRMVVPTGQESHYAEKLVRLPHSFMPHDSGRQVAGSFTRGELGLPQGAFVFCCFNNNYKITPAVFDDWMRILARVPGSVLWLSQNNEAAVSNLRREAARRGVDGARLIFAARMPSAANHLARHAAADLFLDTRPYNAHATALDALWAGLPLLTLPGRGFASRVAASLLAAIDLPELIADSAAHYADLAVELAGDPQRLRQIRDRLSRNRAASPLFDTTRLTRDLETAYALMIGRHRAGLPPDHLVVPG